MNSNQTTPIYKVWAVDGVVYGPVEIPTLIDWAKDERIVPETWIYSEAKDRWLRATEIEELQPHLISSPAGIASKEAFSGVKLGSLRRVKILAELNDNQLERFAQFMEVLRVAQWQEIVRQNQVGDSMYLVLEGELRVRLIIAGKESILTTLEAGEFFGEVSLFDEGPRSADVVANRESLLMKISGDNFRKLISRAPELAAPFLLSVARSLVARTRAENKRFKDSVHMARASSSW